MRSRRVLALVVAMLASSSVALAAPASTVERLPDTYVQLEQQLQPGCGAERASVIANLTWDIDIHKAWAAEVDAGRASAQTVGSAAWHRRWVSVYQHAIGLLAADCSSSR